MKKLLLPLVISLSACSNVVPESSLVGDYLASYGNETATLSLKADRTYTHTVQANGRRVEEQTSTWKATQLAASGTEATAVDFPGFVTIPSFRAKERVKAGWVSEVERTWSGRLQLCFDSDVGYCYVKQR
jgi:hypothetical protein